MVTFCPFCRQATCLPEDGGADALDSDASVLVGGDSSEPPTVIKVETPEAIPEPPTADEKAQTSSIESPTTSNKTTSTTVTASTIITTDAMVKGACADRHVQSLL